MLNKYFKMYLICSQGETKREKKKLLLAHQLGKKLKRKLFDDVEKGQNQAYDRAVTCQHMLGK